MALLVPGLAHAQSATNKQAAERSDPQAEQAAKEAPAEEAFTTGVAKGRDRLDSATSTSALKATEIEKFSARSLGEALRNIPGMRVEYAIGEGNANFTIRGLPMSGTGSKYLQLQEDGLPVFEFGDMQGFGADMFMRFDLNVAQVEAIRGGSASTFASNSPGGVLNLISKTGDVEGGAVQTTVGLNYGEYRVDGDYGHKISDTLRFHVGGFFRQGEGPRSQGFDAFRGGQVKANITKTFSNGYVRVYGKYLNDITPPYQAIPLRVTGTNAAPVYASVPGLDIKSDTLMSPNTAGILGLDADNNPTRSDLRDGQHAIVKSIGFDGQFDFGAWTVSNKFRFADMSGKSLQNFPRSVGSAAALAAASGGAGARLSYATGPLTGQAITDPAALNGNGLLVQTLFIDRTANSLNNATNDLRISRVWQVGNGNLTTTAGFYKSSQDYKTDWHYATILSDVRGGGNAALVNITTAAGVPVTQEGYLTYSVSGGFGHRSYDVNYAINAPYASLNYHIGKIAIGGSVRYDFGKVAGTLFGAELLGRGPGAQPFDVNGNGQISQAERLTGVLPLDRPGRVDYNYGYLSYSGGINFRIAEPLAMFARYSRGGRAAADKILFTPAVGYSSGGLFNDDSGFDTIKQAEIGVKFRQRGLTVNVTAFQAKTSERNSQVVSNADGSSQSVNIVRSYSAKGVEFEGGVQYGVFNLTAGGTYTDAEITADATSAAIIGNTPRRQPSLIFQATPQIDLKHVTFGANVIGTTSSFAQDVNQLKMPGYTLVNAFVQVRPIERVQLMLNVNNLFDTLALADVTQGTIPASGIALGRAYTGRTISGTLRYAF
ncbi:TonB-dependent receptor [Sphingomonas sp. S1-29]|uniref:TonB-dependent receptor domain-containing protein n=1 Tax=Sphingomonas sp. S1-29 TaxID=2991074 RepID=UPI00223FD1C8|nr:TonB-dependent receptor [Sphingomonas sp. S1-29]UZK69215.1 TonB-dependent receptor [Sphingomonas sp. S1-29]